MKSIRLFRLLLPLAVCGVFSASVAGTSAGSGDTTFLPDDFFEPDSVVARRDSLCSAAADAYSLFRHRQSAGEPESEIYPGLYDAYTKSLEAIEATNPGSMEYLKIKEILRDIDPDMEMAAYHYSGVEDGERLGRFARAYVDIQLMKEFEGEEFRRNPRSFPTIVYISSSDAYNKKEYDKAIDYFKTYFSCGDSIYREKVYTFMGQACLNTGRYELALSTMAEGVKAYPGNLHLALIGVNAAIEGGHSEMLQSFLTPALTLSPDDVSLLHIQGKLHEDNNDYAKALRTYEHLDRLTPNSLQVNKHIALCYYNLAVREYNVGVNEPDEKIARRARQKAKNYFAAASAKLEEVLASDPTDTKYLKALAITSLCLEDKNKFDALNTRLTALGDDPLSDLYMPGVMTANADNRPNYEGEGVARNVAEAPSFNEYGKDYIMGRLHRFLTKGEFERMDAYEARVTAVAIRHTVDSLNRCAGEEYLAAYGKNLRLNDLKLMPYDADHETFLVETSYGPVYVPVPSKDGKAQAFKRDWAAVRLRAPEYYIADNGVRIARLSFVTPDGSTYTYDKMKGVNYEIPKIDIDVDAILAEYKAGQGNVPSYAGTGQGDAHRITLLSDVDNNIPLNGRSNPEAFALIFANENYRGGLAKVESALHDGEVFRQYCISTLGIPAENIIYEPDASLGVMYEGVDRLRRLVAPYRGDASIIFYYAGHGMPDEATRDAYLMPVDGSATSTRANIAVSKVYEELGKMDSQGVVAFVDACFSGAQRGEGMLAQARGIALKPKVSAPTGKMFILTAASGQETAMPWREKNHGLFTYFLLKKLQESKGNVSLRDLSDYVIDNVAKNANRINNKPQTPTLSTSGLSPEEWGKRKLRR